MRHNLPLETTLLHTFRAVVEAGSFSAAATQLNCVQSNVTARIKRLEDRLGGRLLERGRGGAKTTPLGALTYARTTDLLDRLNQAETDLREAAGQAAPLRLGAMETTAAARLPALLAQLRAQLPDAKLSLHTAPTAPLVEQVWRHALDAAFVAGPVDSDRFHAIPAFQEHLIALWRPMDALSGCPEMEQIAQVLRAKTPLLAFPQGCSYRASAQSWLRSAGWPDVPVTEMGSLDAMIGCAAAGMGISVVPHAAAQRTPEADGLSRTALPKRFGQIDTYLIWRYDRAAGHALTTLAALLQDTPGPG